MGADTVDTNGIEQYFEAHAVDGVLSDDDMARLLVGGATEGDTAAMAESGEAPAPASDEKSEQNAEAASPEGDGKPDDDQEAGTDGEGDPQGILAKDGKNIIPYDKLIEAREEARAAKAEQAALRQEMESLKAQINGINKQQDDEREGEGGEPEGDKKDIVAMEREYIAAMMEGDEDKAIEVRSLINAEIARQARESAVSDMTASRQAIEGESLMNAAVNDVLEKFPVLNLDKGGDEAALNKVIRWRDFIIHSEGLPPHEALVKAAEEVLGAQTDHPAKQTGRQGQQPAAAGDKAGERNPGKTTPGQPSRPTVPTSLSDIPAGTAAHHDEAEALGQMSESALLDKMMQMAPEKIESLIAKVV